MRRGGSGCQNKNLAALLVLVAAAYSLSSAEAFAPPSNTSYRRNAVVAGGRRSASSARRRSAGGEVSALRMSAAAAPVLKAGVGAIAGAVSGGLFAGGLHAIAGPDHLAALLPRTCGQRWYRAGRIGALWGMGHGVSATIIGVLAFALKNRLSNVGGGVSSLLNGASSALEIAVGGSLIVIGLMGMKEAREWKVELEEPPTQSLSAAVVTSDVAGTMKTSQKRAVVFNGLLHGFSWDGAPSLAPAIAVATWRGNITFLLAYALGTILTMALTTTLIGEGTRRAGQVLQRPDIPQKLSFASSIIAIAVGVFWCTLALK